MKEFWGLVVAWYHGVLVDEGYSFIFLLLAAVATLFNVVSLMATTDNEKSAGLFGSIVFWGAFLVFSLIVFCRLEVMRRFQNEFGFVPPTTAFGRDALQARVDWRFRGLATNFLMTCESEERRLAELKETRIWLEESPEVVAAREAELRKIAKLLKERKKTFWKAHKLAQSSWLPVPFLVLKSIKDYRHISYGDDIHYEEKAGKDAPEKNCACQAEAV